MPLSVLGHTRDLRSDTPVVYCQMDIPQYLSIVGEDFGNFTIQRRRESHKAYRRLSLDIRNGALLPSITLAVKPEFVEEIIPLINDSRATAEALSKPGRVDILDGLQRTYIMHDLLHSRHIFSEDQKILVEFWLESDIKKLIYRIIVLNAGQKPMSIRHQVELLFMSLKTSIESQIDNLQIYTERDTTRRRRSRKFPLNVVVSAYQAHITASTESQKDNIIANRMQIEEALDASEQDISEQFQSFIKYLKIYSEFDDHIFRIYQGDDEPEPEPELDPIDQIDGAISVKPSRNVHWLASENVFVSFFAAVAQFTSSELPENIELKGKRLDAALQKLSKKLEAAPIGTDPLDLEVFDRLRMGNNPRKVNVGAATRKLLLNGFKEFFRDEGDSSLARAWQLASE
ncbi:hypothetical protein [Blastomonas sp. SL216]|uniref:hypothetical protein n=1 Tax=Blastomonas sp. SL216 TaxID=2995169 RepID=UPI0023778A1F|nr:hypothetical protein OU999_01850 [Blastomonas sp. SL216]